jgi:outer membrane immunogenic protein
MSALRFSLTLLISSFALVAVAQAAPLNRARALKARAQVESTADWSGFYIGLNVGGIRGGSLDHYPNGDLLNPALYPPGGPPQLYGSIPSGNAWIGGIHAGYMLQKEQLVYGVEVDFSVPGTNRSYDDTRQLTNGLTGTFQKSLTYKIDWLSTVRGRVGFAFDRGLLYATGGLAFASVTETSYARFSLGSDTYTTSADKNRIGFVLGGGLEYALARSWSIRSEYLYVDLGTQTQNSTSNNSGLAGSYYTATAKNQFQIVRVGLTYKFN